MKDVNQYLRRVRMLHSLQDRNIMSVGVTLGAGTVVLNMVISQETGNLAQLGTDFGKMGAHVKT